MDESAKLDVLQDFEYFKSWYDFFFNVEKYVSQELLAKIFCNAPSNVIDILLHSPVTKTEFKKKLLSGCGLSVDANFDINSKIVRLIVTNLPILKKISMVVGAIFCYNDIIKIISRKELSRIIDSIGKDMYSFIVKRGVMLKKIIPNITIEYPSKDILEKMTVAGKKILCVALVGLPTEIHKRLELFCGEKFDIPDQYDEAISKKCFDLVMFARDKIVK